MVRLTARVLLSLYTSRTRHAVVWTKENPTPWNTIKPDEGTKLITVNQHFDKRYGSPYLGSLRLNHVERVC